MKILRVQESGAQFPAHCVLALGNFDGVHLGHRKVLETARDLAKAENHPLAVMTFEPHPRRFFKPDLPILRIVSFADKARLLQEMGVDFLLVARFSAMFASIAAEDFVQNILASQLKAAHIVTGENFVFGHKRGGNANVMAKECATIGMQYHSVPLENGFSSTAVRKALQTGDIAKVAKILGRAYTMHGVVLHGDKRGHIIGFPTANIRPKPLFLPRFGVYVVRIEVNGASYAGVANLGVRPTMDGKKCLLEVHIMNEEIDLYGQLAKITFLHFIRPEQIFQNLDALKHQIFRDIEIARTLDNEGMIIEGRTQS